MSKKLTGEATPEQIENWKKEHGKVFKYTIEDKICYLRSVDRTTFALAASKVSASPAKFNEVVLEKIWLGGDETIKTVDNYYFGISEFVDELMDKKKGSLETC
jgi:hypothetical protein